MSPFTPHIASECLEKINTGSIAHDQKWPEHDEKLIKEDKINIVIQINGKRAIIEVNTNEKEEKIIKVPTNN